MVVATDTGLRLNRLVVQNFMRIEALQVDAEGQHVIISGPNGKGKTSAVDAIWAALGGKPSKEMPEPIHRGADKATVQLDLGELYIERIWTDAGSRLYITAPDGSKINKPQQLLDGLLSKYALDPIAFLDRRPQDQVDDVLGIAGVSAPVDKVQEITGERHEPMPGESAERYLMRLSADKTGLYYDRRLKDGRIVEQKRAALIEQRTALEALGGPLKAGEKVQSAGDVVAEIDRLQQKQDERRAVQARAWSARNEWEADRTKLDSAQRDVGDCRLRSASLESQIADLQKQLAAEKDKASQLEQRAEAGAVAVAELHQEFIAAEQAVKALPDHTAAIANLRQKLGTVEAVNAKFTKRQLAEEQLGRLAKEVEEALGRHSHGEQVLTLLRHERAHLLDGVELGVSGLEVGDGELRLNGVSFLQASRAERLKTAIAIATKQRPRLRLLRIDDGEHLDSESKELVYRLAEEAGFQVVMTMVADQDDLRVEIVDFGVR
jgi:AAA domain